MFLLVIFLCFFSTAFSPAFFLPRSSRRVTKLYIYFIAFFFVFLCALRGLTFFNNKSLRGSYYLKLRHLHQSSIPFALFNHRTEYILFPAFSILYSSFSILPSIFCLLPRITSFSKQFTLDYACNTSQKTPNLHPKTPNFSSFCPDLTPFSPAF